VGTAEGNDPKIVLTAVIIPTPKPIRVLKIFIAVL
jgi:hypothetical protein